VDPVKIGQIPPKTDIEDTPWHTLCIDLIGPYEFGKPERKNGKGQVIQKSTQTWLHCLTMIDPATGWFEIVEIPNKRADEVANILQMTWFNRYPWPQKVISDRGKEFLAEVDQFLKQDTLCKHKFITTRNPQANSIVERAHKTVHNMIASLGIRDVHDVEERTFQWQGLVSAVGWAMRSTVHTTLNATPAQLVFGRDAIHNIGFVADWQYMRERKQRMIIQNNKKENLTRKPHTYQPGDRVKVRLHQNRKFDPPYNPSPFTVVKHNANGTVELQQETQRGGVVTQTWNIRQIAPWKD
jgi:hypothetical protein